MLHKGDLFQSFIDYLKKKFGGSLNGSQIGDNQVFLY